MNNEILIKARDWLGKRGFDGIVIIVDEIDRIPLTLHGDMGSNHENLFIGSSSTLRALACDVLYTLPIELAYSHRQASLRDAYGTQMLTLPVMPVINQDETVNTTAVRYLGQIIERRVAGSELAMRDIFKDASLLDEILRASGGHVRTLFVLLRSMLDRIEELPISRAVVEQSLRGVAADLARPLSRQDWDVLTQVHTTKRSVNGDNSAVWNRLLRDSYILAYYDDEVIGNWYDWNPLLGYVNERGRP